MELVGQTIIDGVLKNWDLVILVWMVKGKDDDPSVVIARDQTEACRIIEAPEDQGEGHSLKGYGKGPHDYVVRLLTEDEMKALPFMTSNRIKTTIGTWVLAGEVPDGLHVMGSLHDPKPATAPSA